MHPGDARVFISGLEANGLTFSGGDSSSDIAVIDQVQSIEGTHCVWLECRQMELPDGSVIACRSKGDPLSFLVVPGDWTYGRSLYPTYARAGNPRPEEWQHGWRQGSLDTYLNRETGEVRYVGRTYIHNGQTFEELWDAAVELHRAERWQEAAAAWQNTTAIDPLSGDAWRGMGTALRKSGDHRRAVEALKRATAL